MDLAPICGHYPILCRMYLNNISMLFKQHYLQDTANHIGVPQI